MDGSQICVLVLLDYSRAFDTPKNKLLLANLHCLGLGNDAFSWFASYFSDGFQTVKIGNALSEPCDVFCGVPQGWITGPINFTLHMSVLISEVKHGECHFYADDTQILFSIS